ncbi:MFS general substrate transporter [Mycena floridula]|nr:MFS general substrate transporter [Mycena floridula]
MGKFLTCVFIAANAITAGGIFTFPLIAPALATHLKLSQPQLTTIVLAGMVGQYPLSPLVGRLTDICILTFCSLVASLLFSTSFSLFSHEIGKTPDDIEQPSNTSFRLLTLYFAMAGFATVFGYFSFLFAASSNFPSRVSTATGITTATFGLSPLALSLIASKFFTDSNKTLNVTAYLTFLAFLSGFTHLVGAFNLGAPAPETRPVDIPPPEADETTSLLPTQSVEPQKTDNVLKDRYFWLLAMILLVDLGITENGQAEMVISNIGSIVLSLPSPNQNDNTATQVRLLSISNTASRILLGPLADFLSPSVAAPAKRRVNRIVFLFTGSLVISVITLIMAVGIRQQNQLWLLSVGIGASYGTIFSLLPSIMGPIWGVENLARNFGMITYAPFVGTPLFAYLFAFISSAHSTDGNMCQGRACWQTTFWICTATSCLATMSCLVFWRRHKGKL